MVSGQTVNNLCKPVLLYYMYIYLKVAIMHYEAHRPEPIALYGCLLKENVQVRKLFIIET